jgi:excisionase family DNA binding protein
MARLTYDQAAQYLGLSVGSLYRLVHEGKIPFVRVGKRGVRFERAALSRWQGEREVAKRERLRTPDEEGVARLVAEAQELLPDPPDKLTCWTLREVGLYRGTMKVLKGPRDSESDALRKLARLAWPHRSFRFEVPKGTWKSKDARRRHVADVAREVLGFVPRKLTIEQAKQIAPSLFHQVAIAAGGRWKLLNEYDSAIPRARPLKGETK